MFGCNMDDCWSDGLVRIVEQDRLALHATALYIYLCVVYRKEAYNKCIC